LNRLPTEKERDEIENQVPSIADDEIDAAEDAIEKQKQQIRDTIIGRANEDLMDDPAAMKLLSQLGSDLNVNAFACNFRINAGTIVNDDVYAANFLNQRILSKLSAPPSGNIKSVPFWLTSTELSQKEYGNCATHFKKRLGLRGDADIFVLRNVVMSPFSTGGRFISEVLVSEFEKVLREETEVSIMYRVCLQAP